MSASEYRVLWVNEQIDLSPDESEAVVYYSPIQKRRQ